MKNTNIDGRHNAFINKLGLVSIGIFAFGYSIFHASFAEVHLQFPFLDFPIFIGEILLGFCIILFIIKCKAKTVYFNKWHGALLLYFLWILIKAFGGYVHYGAFAFRNAALFYYPLFAIMGYYFYERTFFTPQTILVLISIFIFSKLIFDYYDYFILPYIMLSIILILKLEKRWMKCVMGVLLLLVFDYKILFYGSSRSFLIANILTVVLFVILLFINIIRMRRMYKSILILLTLSLFVSGALLFTDKMQISSLLKLKNIMQTFKEYDAIIEEKKKVYVPPKIKVQLFNKNKRFQFSSRAIRTCLIKNSIKFEFFKMKWSANIKHLTNK